MESFLKSIAVSPSEGKVLQVQPGETHVLKAVSADTDGAYTLIEVIVEPQVGPPVHLHRREAEAFYGSVSLARQPSTTPRRTSASTLFVLVSSTPQ